MIPGRRPLLSVVVPAYQVGRYVDECLVSILNQSWHDLEVVVVDDGSTDGTAARLAAFARADPRVRVHRQVNAGLGAARNVGTALATGTYLTFADSDDVVLPGAYAALVGSLEASGSDLAIGAVHRLDADRVTMTPLMRENHREAHVGVRIDDVPLLLADVFAWNKVYRRSFWDTAGLGFPAGVRYEDQPAITRALIAATGIDSLTEPVYGWRVRQDGSSISQGRARLDDLQDRILTKRWSTELVRAHTAAETQRVWFARVLPIDLWEYFRAVPGCSDDYWDLLRAGLAEFWGPDTVPVEQLELPDRQRRMALLVAADRRADLEALLAAPR
ncbi:glycosyltransferase family 2 protein [Nocardioides mangrovi]|uniref:Glycosyltransferase n=1 Tax=Nocardioides mangrovi TaxID=2874580 RepID=A0ABS7UEC9_9ACTN|nr:glycosyltransferase [Nocardioides mangrovi]MBZ5739237.1 glycosyltransferase [Nocardioides mangrovi]